MSQCSSNQFPLLNEIDGKLDFESIEWNKNAFETLITSNLDKSTIQFYSLEVAFRHLENSFYDYHWDETAEALNNLAKILFAEEMENVFENYSHEAKCQFLMFASIAIVKLHKIRRLSMRDAKLISTTMSLLLFFQNNFSSNLSKKLANQFSKCIESMENRHFQRIFIAGQWLQTVSKEDFSSIQINFERYITNMLEALFCTRSIREKIQNFIETNLLNHEQDSSANDAISSGFVFIQRFPKFDETILEKNNKRMILGFNSFLEKLDKNHLKLLNFSLWTLSCMIQSDDVSLGPLKKYFSLKYFPEVTPIDFEEKPLTINSLNDEDLLVFLILCTQQHQKEFLSIPYSFFSTTRFCNEIQKHWWFSALKSKDSPNFLDHLATIRLDDGKIEQFPPKQILLRTGRILFSAAEKDYSHSSHSSANYHEQYALQYVQITKKMSKEPTSIRLKSKTEQNLFNFSSLKFVDEEFEKDFEKCDESLQHCDELKLLPENSTPIISERNSSTSSPVPDDDKQHFSIINPDVPIQNDEILSNISFYVPTETKENMSNIDLEISETSDQEKSKINVNSENRQDETTETQNHDEQKVPTPETTESEENNESPFFNMIFNHINGVNQWINGFYMSNDRIQTDINAIRDRLDRLNRATNQMISTNIRFFQMDPNENNE